MGLICYDSESDIYQWHIAKKNQYSGRRIQKGFHIELKKSRVWGHREKHEKHLFTQIYNISIGTHVEHKNNNIRLHQIEESTNKPKLRWWMQRGVWQRKKS